MFVHNIDPVAISLGPVNIHWYGIIFALGFILAFFTLPILLKIRPVKNFTKKDISDYVFYMVLGIVIGARVFIVLIYHPSYYLSNPLEIFAVWKGGMSYHGSLLGAILVTYLFCKKRNIHFWEIADMTAIHISFALFLGRIANFINGELWGIKSNVPWCVEFSRAEGCRHPSQLYEASKNLFIAIVLFFMYKVKHKPGFIFSMYILLYGSLRFTIEFVRYSPVHYLGLSIGQLLCIPMILAGAYFVYRLR